MTKVIGGAIPDDLSYDYGTEFSYAVWTPNTKISLHKVPWQADYKDVVDFDSRQDLDNYLNISESEQFVFNNATLVMPGTPVKLDLPFSFVYRYNYLRVENKPMPSKWPAYVTNYRVEDKINVYYYFIQDVQYKAPNTTQLILQLDVFQTFIYNIEFGNAYVERGHIGIANENGFNNYGRNYLNVPEGLDVGNEYVVSDFYYKKIASAIDGNYSVMIISTVDIEKSYSRSSTNRPVLITASGSEMEGLPNGCNIYVCTRTDFRILMETLSNYPHISQGIISVTAMPGGSSPAIDAGTYDMDSIGDATLHRVVQTQTSGEVLTLKDNWRESVKDKIPYKYRNLKKFFTYPYMAIELTTNSGTPLLLKPECYGGDDLKVVELTHFSPPGQRIVYIPYKYNAGTDNISYDNNNLQYDGGEWLDMATGIFDFPTFSVVNNAYLSFMASNRNSIAYQRESAQWDRVRSGAAAELGYNQASANMDLMNSLTGINVSQSLNMNDLNNQTLSYRSAQSAINNTVGGLLNRDLGTAALGIGNAIADYAIGSNQNNTGTAINNNAMMQRNSSQVGNAGYMRDSNYKYANFALEGDYQNAIAGINAKVQDARLLQPTISGQVGGDAFNLANFGWAIMAKIKMIDTNSMSIIGDYWLRYGYAINRYMKIDRISCMEKFTYWKMKELYITFASCTEQFKNAIRGIFEKGVTVWRNPDDIGVVSFDDNNPLTNVRY